MPSWTKPSRFIRSATPSSDMRSTVPCSSTPARMVCSTSSRLRRSRTTASIPSLARSSASDRPAGPAPTIPTCVRCRMLRLVRAIRSIVLQETPDGLYCPAGNFYIDPWGAVDRAIITHGHGDHARAGSRAYLCASPCRAVLEQRLEPGTTIESTPYGEKIQIGGVTVSFHPAGHILGSAQVRVEGEGGVWVVSGDYK